LGKIIADITDSRFNRKLTNLYKLSVHIGADSLVYCIIDSLKRPILLRHWQFDPNDQEHLSATLATATARDPFIRANYGQVQVALDTKRIIVVPRVLFQKGKESELLYALTSPQADEEVHAHPVDPLGIQVIYALPKKIRPLLREYFPLAQVQHLGHAFLLALYQQRIQVDETFALAELQHQQLRIALVQEGQLQFFNTFKVQHAKDVLYFTILAYKMVDLDPLEVPLWICGHVLSDSNVVKQLARYVHHIEWVAMPDFLDNQELFAHIPTHFYYTLFHLHLLGK